MKVAIILLITALGLKNNAEAFGIPEFLEYGSCLDLYTVENFDLFRFSGIWFTMRNVPNEYAATHSCVNTNYTYWGDHITTYEKGLDINGQKVFIRSNIVYEQDTDPKRPTLQVVAEGVPSAPLKIVDTDYDNYACLYSCMSFVGFRAEFAWTLSRQPDTNMSTACDDIFQKHGFSLDKMEDVGQPKNCSYRSKLSMYNTYNSEIRALASQSAKSKGQKSKINSEVNDLIKNIKEEEKNLIELERQVQTQQSGMIKLLQEEKEEEKTRRKKVEKKLEAAIKDQRREDRIYHHLQSSQSLSGESQLSSSYVVSLISTISILMGLWR